MDSRGASMAISSLKSEKPPLIGRNPHLIDLILPCKELTALKSSQLSINLKIIDVSDN
jgi:hypothetical protein